MLYARINRLLRPLRFTGLSEPEQVLTRGSISIIADVRMDDRASLVAKLGGDETRPDCELILDAYRRWGKDCVDHLIGDFSFVIIDTEKGRIFCARDHIGARPLFYTLNAEQLSVASDIACLASEGLNELDVPVAATMLASNRYFPTDRTFLRHIKKLPPGCTLTIGEDIEKVRQFWAPRKFPELQLQSDAEYVAAGREVLERAVSDRLRDTVRPAVHLSGGLDSSAVAAVAARLLRAEAQLGPTAYAWHLAHPDNPTDDETRWAEASLAALDLTIHAPTISADDLTALLQQDWCLSPDASNLFGEGSIMRHAQSQGVDTILSGWGGDEGLSFNGRGYRSELLTSLRLRELASICEGTFPIALARGIKQGVVELAGMSTKHEAKTSIGKTYLRPEIVRNVTLLMPEAVSFRSTKHAMVSLLATGAATARLEDWAIAGRKHGINYSYPLLDRRVMEFALSLPSHLFYRPGMRRWIMREILDPQLPDLVRYNQSKQEPARVARLKKLMYEALQRCADVIAETKDFAGRDELVDVPRLIDDLRGPEEAVMKNLSHKRRAVQFLKF